LKRLMFLIAVVGAALCLTTTALANSGVGEPPPPTDGGSQGKGVSTVKYKAAYTDFFYGPISCAGVHQTGKNFGPLGQDSFTCESTTGGPLPRVTPGQSLTLATTNGWFSDYYYWILSPSSVVFATAVSGTVSDDGYSFTAVATY
jgi:hypothetical protein